LDCGGSFPPPGRNQPLVSADFRVTVADENSGQLSNYRNLNGGQNLSRVRARRGKTKNAIAVLLHQGLEESSRFRKRAQAALSSILPLAEADAGKFRIWEQTGWNLPAGCDVVSAIQIVADDTKPFN